MSRQDDLVRIREALEAAAQAIRPFTPGAVAYDEKSSRGDPVTAADLAANDVLLKLLPSADEGWLSEETADSPERLRHRRVWVVDPLDGTREFVDGIPEWCISVGLVEDGEPVAGGILIPPTGQLVMGAVGLGVTLNGDPILPTARKTLEGAVILASRSEWTLVPKHEWDVAGGAALMLVAGGTLQHADGGRPRFNQVSPKLPNFLAATEELLAEFRENWLG